MKQPLNTLLKQNSYILLNAIQKDTGLKSNIIISKMQLSRKQYYDAIQALQRSGLVRRTAGRYYLTLFGTVIHKIISQIEEAVSLRWKIEAVEIIRNNGNVAHEVNEAMELLIPNNNFKDTMTQGIMIR